MSSYTILFTTSRMTQAWITLCAYLLLVFLTFNSQQYKIIQQLLRLLQLNLFDKRNMAALFETGSLTLIKWCCYKS